MTNWVKCLCYEYFPACALVNELLLGSAKILNVDRVLCPPFIDLWPVKDLLQGSGIGLGAQNLYWEISGAYTGEISPAMVAELCEYQYVSGHSAKQEYADKICTGGQKISTCFSICF